MLELHRDNVCHQDFEFLQAMYQGLNSNYITPVENRSDVACVGRHVQ